MTSLEYLDLAAEITFLQRDLVEDVARGLKVERGDFTERIKILSIQFIECLTLAGAGHQATELHNIYWQLAGERLNGEHSAG
jgi:hypothetical protein